MHNTLNAKQNESIGAPTAVFDSPPLAADKQPTLPKQVVVIKESVKRNPRTGLLDGTLLRDKTTLQYLTHDKLLTATKLAPHTFSIDYRNVKLATLARVQINVRHICYAVYDSIGVLIGSILYKVPSLVQAAMELPPRQAQVALNVENQVDTFEKLCKASVREHSSLSTVPGVLESKKSTSLCFGGRGRAASNKNMHIAGNGELCCQMAKWEKDVFHLDFCTPFTAVTAFAFGIAQLDL